MSIDEMFSALKALGDDLKNRTPSQGSVESLKLLMSYYKHQQEQLKGFEKDPSYRKTSPLSTAG